MNYYDRNFECIKELRIRLYQCIHDYKDGIQEENRIECSTNPSRDGNSYTSIHALGETYRLNSNYRPLEEAKRWVEQFQFDNINIVVQMFGFGNGYFLRELLNKIKKGDHIIVVEPNYQLFHHIISNYDVSDLLMDKRISIVIPELSQTMLNVTLHENVDWMNLKSQIFCVHPQYEKIFSSEYIEYRKKLEEFRHVILVNRNTEAYFGVSIAQNTISNYKYILKSNYILELTEKIPKDIPAIIVAAGPSLDKNIDQLKRAKGKAIIIATDTALRSLHKHGIEADFAITIDPKKPDSYFDVPEYQNMPLFCASVSNHNALAIHHGRKIWFNCHEFIERLYQNMNLTISRYNTGGSVATAAFSVCKTLGVQTIVLIGQDLAYDGDISHAGGEVCHVQAEEEGIRYIDGVFGNKVKTRHDWYIFLKWFENSIQEVNKTGVVIDATEGGALIHGTQIITLQEVIDNYCCKEVDVRRIVDALPFTFDANAQKIVQDYLNNALLDCNELLETATQVIESCNEIIRLQGKNNYESKIEKLAKEIIEKNNQIAIKPLYLLIENYIKHHSMREVEGIGEVENNDTVQTFLSVKNIMNSVCIAVNELEPLLKRAVDELNY